MSQQQLREILTTLFKMQGMKDRKAKLLVDDLFALSKGDPHDSIDKDEFMEIALKNKEVMRILSHHSDKQRRNSLFADKRLIRE